MTKDLEADLELGAAFGALVSAIVAALVVTGAGAPVGLVIAGIVTLAVAAGDAWIKWIDNEGGNVGVYWGVWTPTICLIWIPFVGCILSVQVPLWTWIGWNPVPSGY